MDSTSPSVNPRSPAPASGALPSPDARSRRIARLVFAAGMVCLALWVAWPYVAALAWAIVIAIAVWPLYVRFAERTPDRQRAFVAPLVFTLITAAVLALPLLVVVIEIGREAQTLLQWVSEARQNGVPVPGWLIRLPLVGEYLDRWWSANLSDPKAAGELLGGVQGDRLAQSGAIGWQLLKTLFLVFLTFMTLFFLLRDGARIGPRLLEVTDRWLGGPGERLAEKMVCTVRGTVNGTVLVAVGEGALIGLGYVFAGVPHPVLFSIVTMAGAMITLGAWLTFGIAALILTAQGSALAGAAVFGWGAVVMLAGDNFVQPALIGAAARLPLVWALIGIFGGIEAFGLVGLFLGPVILAALLTIWHEWVEARRPPDART